MHAREWFAQMERDYNEREERLAEARESLAAFQAEMATRTSREVKWMCPYCTQEIDEHAPHCGEAGRAVPITDGDEDEN